MNANPEHIDLLRRLSQQAAAWWRGRLAGDDSDKFDNGDNSALGAMGGALAREVAAHAPTITHQQLDAFEQALAATVLSWLMEDPCPPEREPYYAESEEERQKILAMPRRKQCFGTDYGPDGWFYPALEAASIKDTSVFPWKTLMWVCWDERPQCCYIEVKGGYGGKTERLSEL